MEIYDEVEKFIGKINKEVREFLERDTIKSFISNKKAEGERFETNIQFIATTADLLIDFLFDLDSQN